MEEYLTVEDNQFINFLTNKNNEISNDYKLLFNYITNNNKTTENINDLYNLFVKLNSENYLTYRYLTFQIMKKITNIIRFEQNTQNLIDICPSNLLSDENIKYLVSEKILFKSNLDRIGQSLFDRLISTSQLINHFNFKLDEDYIPHYIVLSKRYYDNLNEYLNTINLSLIDLHKVKFNVNYIELILDLLNKGISNSNVSLLVDTTNSLYELVTETLISQYYFNLNIIKGNDYYSDSQINISGILEEINYFESKLKRLLNNNVFIKKIRNELKNKYYLNDMDNNNSFINIVSFIVNDKNENKIIEESFYKEVFYELNTNLGLLFNSKYINIHHKIKFIKEDNINLFENQNDSYQNSNYYKELLEHMHLDILALAEMFTNVKSKLEEIGGIKLAYLTLSSYIHSVFLAQYDFESDDPVKKYNNCPYYILSGNEDKFIRNSYIGGVVDIYIPYGEDLEYYDFNSMYPSVMLNNEFGYGKPI